MSFSREVKGDAAMRTLARRRRRARRTPSGAARQSMACIGVGRGAAGGALAADEAP